MAKVEYDANKELNDTPTVSINYDCKGALADLGQMTISEISFYFRAQPSQAVEIPYPEGPSFLLSW